MTFPFIPSVLLALLIADAPLTPGQSPIITAPSVISIFAVSTNDTVSIAQRFEVRIEVTAPKGSRVAFATPDESLGVFDVLGVQDIPDIPVTDKQSRWTRILSLETIRIGPQSVPPIDVTVQDDNESKPPQTLSTEPIPIEIESVLAPDEQNEPAEFRDIAGELSLPEPVAPRSSNNFWIGAMMAAALVFFGALVWFVRWVSNRPGRWCRREIARLKNMPITDAGNYVETMTAWKEVVRVATSGSNRRLPQSQSTSDMLAIGREHGFDDSQVDDLHASLRYADRLKFASGAAEDVAENERESLRRSIHNLDRFLLNPEPKRIEKPVSTEGRV